MLEGSNPNKCSKKFVYGDDGENDIDEIIHTSNFNYFPFVWHFCSNRDTDKMEKKN